MKILSIDLETYCDVDLPKTGVHKYVEDPSFEILLFAYAWNDNPVNVIDLTSMSADDLEMFRDEVNDLMNDPEVQIHAWNCAFEHNCLQRWLNRSIPLDRWWDSMINAAVCGLPLKLKDAGDALGLPVESQKDREGKLLLNYFCKPCKPTKANGMRTRNLPSDAPEKWQRFIEYNRQDVVAERAIWNKVKNYTPDEKEHQAWILDQGINDRGIRCDKQLAEGAVAISEKHTVMCIDEMKRITGLENPNSVSQLGSWLGMPKLDKDSVEVALESAEGERKRVLELRKETGKSSTKKYAAMLNSICADGRCRGLFQFYGANRSGRWAGRIVQLQNLPQNHLEDLGLARQIVRKGDYETLDLLYDNIPQTLSELIRTCFIPMDGYLFAVADFSAIEARVIAWLASEKWRMDLFAEGGDIYCQSASKMFGVPVVKHGINGHLRAKGKVAELACGYGGSVGAMVNMGALKMGLEEDELQGIVDAWRAASPHIVNMWWDFGNAMTDAVSKGKATRLPKGVGVYRTNKLLHMKLPSGRCLRYYEPRIEQNRFGGTEITYGAYEQGRWSRVGSYGPKFVENCLAGTTMIITHRGFKNLDALERDDLVWDGEEFVRHEGLIDQGMQKVVKFGETYATPDHRILTEDGWMTITEAAGHTVAQAHLPFIYRPDFYDTGWPKPTLTVERCKRYRQVFDIRNCGPRHQFCILNNGYPMIVHNCVQGIARDCLLEAMTRVAKRFPRIVMHVHDEMIVEVPKDQAEEALGYMCTCMAEPIPWAPGLLLRGDGFITPYYRKD